MKAKGLVSAALLLALALMPVQMAGASAPETDEAPILTATEAREWEKLFDRRGASGTWLGADGIYSVSLDGKDAFGSSSANTESFFIFSDTLMGSANREGEVIHYAPMPAQSAALLSGDTPREDAISFLYGEGGGGRLGEHLFGEHKWMLDCYVHNDSLFILGFPEENWKPKQIDMITVPIRNGEPMLREYSEAEAIPELWHRVGDEYLYAFGIGITPNTESAGAPDPDGYIYIYGYRDAMREFSRKDMIVGRIHESDFPDFTKFRYWDGEGWSESIEECKVLIPGVSCEMSVSPVPVGPYSGKYIAVYTDNTRSSDIMYAIGDTPYGPFDTPVKCYNAPEHGEPGASGYGTRVVYNAKSHPHLSHGDRLLISYNVNVEGEGVRQWTTDYHPRFIYLDLDPASTPETDITRDDGAGADHGRRMSGTAIAILVTSSIAAGAVACLLIRRKQQ